MALLSRAIGEVWRAVISLSGRLDTDGLLPHSHEHRRLVASLSRAIGEVWRAVISLSPRLDTRQLVASLSWAVDAARLLGPFQLTLYDIYILYIYITFDR